MSLKLYILLTGMLLVILGLAVSLFKSNKKSAEDTIFTGSKKGVDVSKVYAEIYFWCKKVPLLRKVVDSVRKIFESYYPDDETEVLGMTFRMLGISSAVVVTVILLVFMKAPSFFMLCCSLVTVYVVTHEILNTILYKNECKLLNEVDVFMELLQFHYLQSGMVDEAIHDSIIGKNKMAERHAKMLLAILAADDIDGQLVQYTSTVQNSFLKELACICVTVFTYGDTQIGNESAFLYNLKKLKDRVSFELLRKDQIKHSFAGLGFLILPPMLVTKTLTGSLVSSLQELEAYYNGFYGMIVDALLPVVTLLSYIIISKLKSDGATDKNQHGVLTAISNVPFIKGILVNYYNHNYGIKLRYDKLLKATGSRLTAYTLAVKRALFAVVGFLVTMALFVSMSHYTKSRIETSVVGTGSKSSIASEEDSIKMMMLIKAYTTKYLQEDLLALYREETGGRATTANAEVEMWLQLRVLDELAMDPISISEEDAMFVILQYNTEHASSTTLYTAYLGSNDGPIRDENESMKESGMKLLNELREDAQKPAALEVVNFNESVASDVASGVCSYNNAFVHWYYVLVAFGVAAAMFFVPYLWIVMFKEITQQLMEKEVMQFQSLILILRNVRRMSAQLIMDWMLLFAEVFRPGIHKCIINMPTNEEKACEDLIESEPFEPFQELMRELEMCDKVSVYQAFSNLEVVQNSYSARSKQKAAQRLSRNISISSLVLYVPWVYVVILYATIPLLIESFGQLTSSLSSISTM